MKVAKWGNSLAVRLPSSVVDALKLKEGDDVELHAEGARDLRIVPKPTQQELIERLRKYRGSLPADFKFDRDEANDR